MLESNLSIISTVVVLAYMFPACYYDIRDREMPVGFWTLLFMIDIPITAFLYFTGYYPLEMLGIGIVFAMVYAVLLVGSIYQGADCVYLMAISLFLVQHPITGNYLMPIAYFIWLVAAWVITGILYQEAKALNLKCVENMQTFPAMVTISLALILTMVMI